MTDTNPQPIQLTLHDPEGLDAVFKTDLSHCEFEVCLASVSKGETMPVYRRLDLSPSVQKNFRQIVVEEFQQREKGWRKKDLAIRDFSYESAQNAKEVEFIDLTHYPTIAQQIVPLADYQSIPTFEGHKDPAFLQNLRFYVIIVHPQQGKPVYLYRVSQHMQIIDHRSFLAVQFNKNLYDRVEKPLFLFDKSIDCLSHGSNLYIFNKHYFCQIFSFWELLERTAQEVIQKIQQKDLIHNFEAFRDDCLNNQIKLLKLKNISLKPYLDTLTIENVHSFIEQQRQQQQKIDIRILRIDGKDKMVYEPQKDPWAILHLLDDSHLDSKMTNVHYLVTGGKQAMRRR